MDATLLLYGLIAAGLVFWLRSILGTRHGDERERPNPFTTPAPETKREAITDAGINEDDTQGLALGPRAAELPRNVIVSSDSVQSTLSEIARIEPSFDVSKFTMAAQDAFAMIVEAFAAADRDTLKEFLAPQVYKAFDGAIADREVRGESMSNEIHAVRKAEVLGARIDGKTAYVTFRFIADETCIIKDRDGQIISGHPDRVTEMNDIWTFSRVLRDSDPKWFLYETRDGDVTEDHKTPIPDSV